MKPETGLLYQAWTCEQCGAAGEVHHRPEDDALRVAEFIKRQHAAMVPDCAEKHSSRGVRLGDSR